MNPNEPTSDSPSAGSPASAGPLRMLFWESTSRCNLRCIHCRRLDDEAAAPADLTTGEVRAVFESAVRLGKPVIVFSGGEPLLRPDWRELAVHAGSLGLPAALATNGTLIDDRIAEDIKSAGFRRVAISLDGPDAATHDAFRGLPGAFERTMAGIGRLTRVGVPVQINATIAAHNFQMLDRLADLAQSAQVQALHLFLLVPVGCGEQIEATHQLTAGQYEQVLEWAVEHSDLSPADNVALASCPCVPWASSPMETKQLPTAGTAVEHMGGTPMPRREIQIRVTCAPHFYRLAAQRGLDIGRSRGCLCGLTVLFVSHDGKVFPCGYLPVDCGSVRQKPLDEIWRSSRHLARLRNFGLLSGKCGLCEFKAVCGGCRARAFAATGDVLAQEPFCQYQPNGET
ncbi:MAG: radical SAM protein [Planctomycetes bacterium]|nr:radical SAM protein [Planctomycetota bacterium]